MSGKRILLIDDDADIHAILKTALEREGYQVFSALDAMQGPMQARQIKPDLIILDIMMPAGGGVSVFNRIRQNTNTLNIPILIYSAVPPDQIRETLPAAAGVPVLTKPTEIPQILSAVARAVASSS